VRLATVRSKEVLNLARQPPKSPIIEPTNFGKARNDQNSPLTRSYDHRKYSVNGVSAITDRGMLKIAWPVPSDTGNAVTLIDLLLATATKPTPVQRTGDYPTAEQIAAKWTSTQDDQYFRENRNKGFHTFQDEEIAKHLKRRSPARSASAD
jgi:hypothetical protein